MKATERQKLDHIRLARSQSIGPVAFQKLIEMHGSASNALDALMDGPQSKKVCSESVADIELSAAEDFGASTLCLGFDDYPARLAAIPGAPPLLYVKGQRELLNARTAAIVGARNASAAGLKITRTLACALGEAGVTTVSGLARGIDTAAHTASVPFGTIACLAGGLDVVYPQENKGLYLQIMDTGLLVSEMPPGTKPQARHFPRRNRIISGLSDGVIIIEAAAKSGSLITARFAAEQGRDIFAVPGSPLDPRSAGGNRLIKDGAILTRNADDVLAELGAEMPLFHQQTTINEPIQSTSQEQHASTPAIKAGDLLALLNPNPTHMDEIIVLSGLSAERIATELQMLELDGKITRHSGGRFSRIE